MGVEEPDPEVALQCVEFTQQRAEGRGVHGQLLRGGAELVRRRDWTATVRSEIVFGPGSVIPVCARKILTALIGSARAV
jgi:hypothetical protein